MPLSNEAVESFREAYRKDFHEELSFEEARVTFTELALVFNKLRRNHQRRLSTEGDLTNSEHKAINTRGNP